MQGIFYFFLKKLGKAKVFNMETKNSCFPLFFIFHVKNFQSKIFSGRKSR